MNLLKQVFTTAHTLPALLLVFAIYSLQAATVTPAQFLTNQPKPHFKTGHRLPWLGMGWPCYIPSMASDLNSFLGWIPFGYAMTIGPYLSKEYVLEQAANTNSIFYKLVQLHKANPARYPIGLSTSRNYLDGVAGGGSSTAYNLDPSSFLRDANGNYILDGSGGRYMSTEGDIGWKSMAHARAEGLRALKNLGVINVDVIFNPGEYSFFAYDSATNVSDPAVKNALAASGGMSWYEYNGKATARLEKYIADSINSVFLRANRGVYVRYTATPVRDRGATWHTKVSGYGTPWPWWSVTNDLPSQEYYYSFGWGCAGFEYTKKWWTVGEATFGGWDMPRMMLNNTAQCIATGFPLSYHWLSVGTGDRPGYLPLTTYMGWMKFLYTQGMIGAVVQDYTSNSGMESCGYVGHDASFDNNNPPHWISGFIAHGHVHALFSNVDDFLYEGDLLPGPTVNDFSSDLPGYEFPVPEDVNIHVVARKKWSANQWLVCAWLASDTLAWVPVGLTSTIVVSKKANVTIPGIGTMTVNARSCGSVYIVKDSLGTKYMKQLDPNSLDPSNIPGDNAYVPVVVENLTPATWNNITPQITSISSWNLNLYEYQGRGRNIDKGYPCSVGPDKSAWSKTSAGWEILLDRVTNVPLTVNYQVTGGTATQGVDYETLPGTVTIPAGKDYGYILVTPIHDSIQEPQESITITMQAGTHYTLPTVKTVSAYIINDATPLVPPVSVLDRIVGKNQVQTFIRNATLHISSRAGISSVKIFYPNGKCLGSIQLAGHQTSMNVRLQKCAKGAVLIKIETKDKQNLLMRTVLF